MFESGQIITKEEHVAFVNWNNANGDKLRSVSVGDGTYRLKEIPAPTTEELSAQKRAERNAILDTTDKFTSIPDYPITNEKREKYKKYRQYLRDIPQQDDFPNIEILSFEDWLLTQENN